MASNETPVSTQTAAEELENAGETIHLTNLQKEFGDVIAVEDLSLHIHEGEFLVLLGPSGCGKTTTLRMVAGLETPTDGEIHIGDREVTRELPQKRELSMVFQSYALYPHKSARENLEFPLNKMDLSDDEMSQKIQQVAEMLEIEDLLEKQPGQLSGGQRQRVALGRTVIREPQAFLMDEPLSNLDAKLRVKTRAELRTLQQDLGTTTVYVTHDQEEAMSLADRIAVMDGGVLQQIGTPREIYTNPVNRFVASFIGEPAMNFFSLQSGRSRHLFPHDPVQLNPNYPDEIVTLGVRPEHIHFENSASGELNRLTPAFECEIDVIEPLGNAYEIDLNRGETTFTARLRSIDNRIKNAEAVSVVIDADAVHRFDSDGVSSPNGDGIHG